MPAHGLTDRERIFWRMRHGRDGSTQMTIREMSRRIGLTTHRVVDILKSAQAKLEAAEVSGNGSP